MAIQTIRTGSSKETDRAERARRVEQAIHSGRMEGLNVTGATRADAQDYVDGQISSRELRARVRARYGTA